MKLRVVYADDEPLARQRLQDLLAREEDVEIVAACENGDEAARVILREEPDIVLLDVQMPGLDGFEVVEALGDEAAPAIIFVTAYDEFALQAFEAHAIDYLLKPVVPERFSAAMERARAQVRHIRRGGAPPDLGALLDTVTEVTGYPERIVVRVAQRLILVRVDTIDWIGADGNYAVIHVGKQTHLLRETMSRLERRLDPRRFMRIHRSRIVNLERVREIQSLSSRTFVFVLEDGSKLESSSGFRQQIQSWIDQAG